MLEITEQYFNVDHGYLEGLVRGCKADLLTQQDYISLAQCKTLEEIRKQIKTVLQYLFPKDQRCSYMIDNVVLLMNGTLQKKSMKEVLRKCCPLGQFTEMEAVNIAEMPSDLFNAVLVETPLDCMSENTLDELNIEILHNKLYKLYLEAFYKFCKNHSDVTTEIMCSILEFEANRCTFIITLNSFGMELSKDDLQALYPTCGKLYPEGLHLLAQADDFEQMKRVADHYRIYKPLFETMGDGSGGKSLEDVFYEHEVKMHVLAFNRQFHCGMSYAYIKLREQ